MNIPTRMSAVFFLTVFCFLSANPANGQDEAEVPRIDFLSVIKPILQTRCTTCHNEEDEEGGVNLDDLEMLQEYIEPEKPLESPLFQSLTGSNDLSRMPPEEDNNGDPLDPCSSSERALIYLWIQQGASLEGVPVVEEEKNTDSAPYRILIFSGHFHPAIVHFPIALITISAFFIIFFFRNEAISDDAAYYLLFFGTLSSIVACVLGWGFAEKNPVSISDMDLGVNRHRWFGILGTVIALVSTIIGWRARSEIMSRNRGSNGMWKFGVILTAALMGWVGHQGGELVYNEGFYERAAEKYIPEYWPFEEAEDTAGEPAAGKNPEAGNEDGSQEQGAADAKPQVPAPKEQGDSKSVGEEEESDNAPPQDPTLKNREN